jgi:hypothetical protein
MTAAEKPYSVGLHQLLEHNQELIRTTIHSRQLIQDYYPDASGVDHNELCTSSGRISRQWGRFEHQKSFRLRGKIYAKKKTDTYSDDTKIYILSTSRLLNPNVDMDTLLDVMESGLYCDLITINSTSYAYYEFNLLPDPGFGQYFYVSAWRQSAHATLKSEVYWQFTSIWEEPEQ